MSHTTKKITTESSTRKKGESSERPTRYKQDKTTESSTTSKTNKVEIKMETSITTTKLPAKEGPKSLDLKYVIIIVAVLLLMLLLLLCVAVSCLCFKSRNSQNVNVSFQYTHRA